MRISIILFLYIMGSELERAFFPGQPSVGIGIIFVFLIGFSMALAQDVKELITL